jgi:glycine cleavage system aminomethyltransferase T
MKAYLLNHTPGGSIQFGVHYQQAMPKELVDALMEQASNSGKTELYNNPTFLFNGSAGNNTEKRQRNPFELGLGKIVDFSHDFVGKKALEEYKANPKSTGVTLEWNKEDILDVYASQFRDEEPYQAFETPSNHMNIVNHQVELSIDLVFGKDGKEIGISGGRTESPWHRAMLSLASIELPYAELGTEVFVLWGDVGRRQKKIRATVVPTPYNTNYSNWTFDVNQIPRLSGKQK